MILFINACVRKESRTLPLAEFAAERMGGDVERVDLDSLPLVPFGKDMLEKREADIAAGDYSDAGYDLAKQFRNADAIVIAAPYWDLSFPSALKCYVEHVCVRGLTFEYGSDGMPVSLCRAKKLVYVSTSGGYMMSEDHGFGYVRQVFGAFFGVAEAMLFKAEGLDIFGADVDSISDKCRTEINNKLTVNGEENKMEEHEITIRIRTSGEKCEMTDAEIREWYLKHVGGLFNKEYGTPDIDVTVERKEI